MTDEKMTAGQYYLARIGTALSDMQTTLNALREAREAELAEGLKERVREVLNRFGIYATPSKINSGWRTQTTFVDFNGKEIHIDLDDSLLGELPENDTLEICTWDSRIHAFRHNRKQSVDQFIKFVRLKTPRVVQHTESELAALWDQWLDYLVATK